jgi:hypothetical protein
MKKAVAPNVITREPLPLAIRICKPVCKTLAPKEFSFNTKLQQTCPI